MISRYFTTSIANSRMQWASNKSSLQSVGTFLAQVQDARPETIEMLGEAHGKVFNVWCAEGTDVKPGDTLTIASGDYAGTYSVRSKQTHTLGANPHIHLIIIKDVT